nr:TetR/AcrR family transcriptional regulator [Rhizobium sp. ACO-34A]
MNTSAVGRPPLFPDEERRGLILQAAERVFDAVGYGAATMEEVARECGMAKKTVYKFFPDKASLFSALIDSHDTLIDDWTSQSREGMVVEEHFRQLLLELSAFILSPRQLTLTRLVIAEARKSPDLARRFHKECMEKTLSFVTHELERGGLFAGRNPQEARRIADMFIGATLGAAQISALMLDMDQESLRRELVVRVEIAAAMLKGVLELP